MDADVQKAAHHAPKHKNHHRPEMEGHSGPNGGVKHARKNHGLRHEPASRCAGTPRAGTVRSRVTGRKAGFREAKAALLDQELGAIDIVFEGLAHDFDRWFLPSPNLERFGALIKQHAYAV